MFIELHMLQNFAPSNLNRDDTGQPKDCQFGGHRRARISSQCIKRAVRMHPLFAKTTQAPIAIRTRWLARMLRQRLEEAGKATEEATLVATAFVEAFLKRVQDERSSVLMYLSEQERDDITALLLDRWDEALSESQPSDEKESKKGSKGKKDKASDFFKDEVKALIKRTKERTSAPDVALFGRMLADHPELNIDAACQMAHAISTSRVSMEMDYFTAVDDLKDDDTSGAGMLGYTSFNSACFYRYARLDWDLLTKNLDGDTALARRTVEGFLRASVAAVPSGKQNSFAAMNPPDFLLAVVRKDGQSWSLANAFEAPVTAGRFQSGEQQGLVAPSIKKLESYWGALCDAYGGDDLVPFVMTLSEATSLDRLAGAYRENLGAWLKDILEALPGE